MTHGTIYTANPSILNHRAFGAVPTIESFEAIQDGEGNAAGMIFRLKSGGQVKANYMPEKDLFEHLKGFHNFVSLHSRVDDKFYVLNRIKEISFVLGFDFSQHKDPEEAVNFLFALNNRLNGLMMFESDVVDFTGDVLTGKTQ